MLPQTSHSFEQDRRPYCVKDLKSEEADGVRVATRMPLTALKLRIDSYDFNHMIPRNLNGSDISAKSC